MEVDKTETWELFFFLNFNLLHIRHLVIVLILLYGGNILKNNFFFFFF